MTIKMYDPNAYATQFEAEVISCEKCENGYKVVLDKTLFFPEEGGQTPDEGKIEGCDVFDVQIKDGEIYHFLKRSFAKGEIVTGCIDFKHRFKNMQMHSAEHIFSGLVHERFGYDNVGFHLSDNDATMDYNGKLSDEDIAEIEKCTNIAIYSAHEIKTYYPAESELEFLDYRSKAGIEGAVRMVEIEGVDLCACCAPHVKNTSEIGIFKVIRYESYKGGTRLHYLAGERAYEFLKEQFDSIQGLSRMLSVSPDKITEAVDKLQKDKKELEFSVGAFKRSKIDEDITARACEKGFEAEKLIGNCIYVLKKEDAALLRFSVDVMKRYFEGIAVALCGDDESGYRFIIESDCVSVKEKVEILKNSFDCKCGGKDMSVQGNIVAGYDDIKAVFYED